mmetsp:Transcript_72402/g.132189  ORF Transcript_72402/g.132189 Transcript_72402/m.132189 type:complete len:95 (+) Transcript_72402:727-1011(+)
MRFWLPDASSEFCSISNPTVPLVTLGLFLGGSAVKAESKRRSLDDEEDNDDEAALAGRAPMIRLLPTAGCTCLLLSAGFLTGATLGNRFRGALG